jgi:hypothetical protein
MKMNKNVKFNLDKNIVHYTYTLHEYNRIPINSLYHKILEGKIPHSKLNNIFYKLNKYKLQEMVVHKKSLCNTAII